MPRPQVLLCSSQCLSDLHLGTTKIIHQLSPFDVERSHKPEKEVFRKQCHLHQWYPMGSEFCGSNYKCEKCEYSSNSFTLIFSYFSYLGIPMSYLRITACHTIPRFVIGVLYFVRITLTIVAAVHRPPSTWIWWLQITCLISERT